MRKFTFFAALLATISVSKADAQSFHMDGGDTVKKVWTTPGDINILNKPINTTPVSIKLTWKFINFHTDPGWTCGGFCDNITCYSPTSDLTSGAVSQTTDNFAPGPISDFHIIFNGDAAANGTMAYATLLITDPGTGDDTTATFIATKNGTGITVIRVDENAISVYPNPAQNYVDVRYPATADVRNIAIYNLIGKQVSNYRVSSNTSAHCEFGSDMPSGIYMLRIIDSKGGVVSTRRFTKQ